MLRLGTCFIPLALISWIFTQPTIYISALLAFFLEPTRMGNMIIVNNVSYELVEACIASLAYLLLIILSMLTKDISWNIRGKIILWGSSLIFAMNALRIVVLLAIGTYGNLYLFDKVHLLFWHILSGIFVAAVWIFLVERYKIKSIPILDDVKYLYQKSIFKK